VDVPKEEGHLAVTDEFIPLCEKCGAEVTTGAMAMFCPRREQCEFWPPEGLPEPFDKWAGEAREHD
jgi:hypothetical protein